MHSWTYDEHKHCGVDYSDIKQAEVYDRHHQKFRNYEKEVIDLLATLPLKNTRNMTLIDLGCGTGATAIHAAEHFKKIYAVDISEVMIQQAVRKAEQKNITNIEFIQAGFLSYEHNDNPADMIMTKAAFHHLPDFWKQIALLRINNMLKKGGILYLFDIVFHFKPEEHEQRIEKWISNFEKQAGREFKNEIEIHIRDEFSTFSWIMEGMLQRAGFIIESIKSPDGFTTEYFCTKT